MKLQPHEHRKAAERLRELAKHSTISDEKQSLLDKAELFETLAKAAEKRQQIDADETAMLSEEELKRQTLLGIRDWTLYPPTVAEVKAWRAAVNKRAARGLMISFTGPGSIHFLQMSKAEKPYKALGLL